MAPRAGQRIGTLLLAVGALAALPAWAAKPGDCEQLARLDDATGLPRAFGGAHLGDRERDLESRWKGYSRPLGGQQFADGVLAYPIVDDASHRVVKLVLAAGSHAGEVHAMLARLYGAPRVTGPSGAAVWVWPARRVRASVSNELPLVFEPYRPLRELDIARLLSLAGSTVKHAERTLGVRAEHREIGASHRFKLPATEFGAAEVAASVRKGRLVGVSVVLEYPGGDPPSALLEAAGAATRREKSSIWVTEGGIQIEVDQAGTLSSSVTFSRPGGP